MKLISLVIVTFAFISVTSCSPSAQYEAELNEIDSCMSILDTIQSKYNGIDFDSLNLMVDHVKSNEDSIAKYYVPDTLSMQIGITMNECKGIRKSLQSLDTKKLSYSSEISELKTQFENLKNDIKNGVISEEKIKEYLDAEKEDLNNLNVSLTNFYELQELQKRYYYQSVPIIDELIVQWRAENDAEESQ